MHPITPCLLGLWSQSLFSRPFTCPHPVPLHLCLTTRLPTPHGHTGACTPPTTDPHQGPAQRQALPLQGEPTRCYTHPSLLWPMLRLHTRHPGHPLPLIYTYAGSYSVPSTHFLLMEGGVSRGWGQMVEGADTRPVPSPPCSSVRGGRGVLQCHPEDWGAGPAEFHLTDSG